MYFLAVSPTESRMMLTEAEFECVWDVFKLEMAWDSLAILQLAPYV